MDHRKVDDILQVIQNISHISVKFICSPEIDVKSESKVWKASYSTVEEILGLSTYCSAVMMRC